MIGTLPMAGVPMITPEKVVERLLLPMVTWLFPRLTMPPPSIEPALTLPSPSGPWVPEKSNVPPAALLMRRALPPVLVSRNWVTPVLLLVIVALPAVAELLKLKLVMLALPAVLVVKNDVL